MEPQQSQPLYTPPVSSPLQNDGGKKIGPIVAILIVLLVILAAAFYYFAYMSPANIPQALPMDNNQINMTEPVDATLPPSLQVQPVTDTADDLQSIERDLEQATTDMDPEAF